MPVATSGPPPARQALLVGLGVICGLGAIIFLITQLDQLTSSGEGAGPQLGAPIFSPGSAEDMAEVVEERPFFLPDASGGERGIWLQHLGDDPTEGWVAVAIRAPDADAGCFVEWQPDADGFVDLCDGTVYPPDGEGLRQYPVSVDPDGDLTINLNRDLTGSE
ncbi:MAG: hypothetical protein AAF531_15280 [Actinomycetota bacterium]